MKAFLSSVFLLFAASASVRAFESPEHDVAAIEESEEMTLFGDLEEFTETFEAKSDKSKSKDKKSKDKKSKDKKSKDKKSKDKKSKDKKSKDKKSKDKKSKDKKSKDKKKKSSSSSSKSKRNKKDRGRFEEDMCDCDMKNKDRDSCEDYAQQFNCYHGSQDDYEEDTCEWLGIYDRDSCSSLDGYADGYANKSAGLRGYVEFN